MVGTALASAQIKDPEVGYCAETQPLRDVALQDIVQIVRDAMKIILRSRNRLAGCAPTQKSLEFEDARFMYMP